MSKLEADTRTFIEAVNENQVLWSALDLRTIAIYIDNQWLNLMTRVIADSRPPEDIPKLEFLPEADLLICRHCILPLNRLEDLVREVWTGVMRFADERIDFRAHDADGALQTYQRSHCRLAADIEDAPETDRFRKGHALRLASGQSQRLFSRLPGGLDSLNERLRALPHPWDGLDSLTRYGLRTTARIDYQRDATIDFVAPLQARIESARIAAGRLEYGLTVGSSSAASACELGLFHIRANENPAPKTVRPLAWTKLDEGQTCSEECAAPAVQQVTLMLRLGRFVADQQTVLDLSYEPHNPRLVAYAAMDPDLEVFKQFLLNPKPSEQKQFHSVVARLFCFAGFCVDSFVADAKLDGRGAVDLLVHSPQDRCLFVVECTTTTLLTKEGKMSRLVGRATEIREHLVGGTTNEVIPVMATSRKTVPQSELDAAATDHVVVLTVSNLDEFFELARAQHPLPRIIEWCKDRIPPKLPPAPPFLVGRR